MDKGNSSYISFEGTWLGDVVFAPTLFEKSVYAKLDSKELLKMSSFDKHHFVGTALIEAIKAAPHATFIFPAIVDFITKVREKVLPTYTFYSFEMFLDQYVNIGMKESLFVRGKIVGRFIPRNEYQAFFPIGMGNTFKGSHFSVAHFSPDVDTVIASFHGYLDAFAAMVGEGIHYWQVPSGPPVENIEIENLFRKALGKQVFEVCVNTGRELTLTSMDLVSQKNMITKSLDDKAVGARHNRAENSVVVTKENGEYFADWRAIDFDEVRLVIGQFGMLLRAFEKSIYMGAVTSLLKKEPFEDHVDRILQKTFADYIDRKDTNPFIWEYGESFIRLVVGLQDGMKASFESFLDSSEMFEDVIAVMHTKKVDVEQTLSVLQDAFAKYFEYLDTLEVAIAVKRKVLEIAPMTLSHTDTYETIKEKMEGFSHLTVVHKDKTMQTPLGVIHAKDLRAGSLATVSIRDFSNGDEMDKAPYMDIISCIDHHKSELTTKKPARMIVSDAQSSNSIIARMNMEINSRYSTFGLTKEQTEVQIKEIEGFLNNPTAMRLMQKLLSIKEVFARGGVHYISRDKEFLDYYHFLFAILDDTDLLTKVTAYDVFVVRDLLNHMKSLMVCKMVEVIDFDDLDHEDVNFADLAAAKLLQTHDLYSLYNANHSIKEKKVDEMLKKATSTLEVPFFQDTKILGKYAQIGQFKMFANNHATFQRRRADIQKYWLKKCKDAASEKSGLSLFVFMVSTVDSASDLFTGSTIRDSKVKDEIWITCLENDRISLDKMKRFCSSLLKSPKVFPQSVEVCLKGEASSLKDTLAKISGRIEMKVAEKEKALLAELFVDIKSLKSRKSDIAPYL